jgi:hypothetical protein
MFTYIYIEMQIYLKFSIFNIHLLLKNIIFEN